MEMLKSFDGQVWGNEFCRIAREKGHHLDMDWVAGWFSNALMRGYDEGQKPAVPAKEPEITIPPKKGK